MGGLQPGLPNPAMLPELWHLLIIDLKDCLGEGNARADQLVNITIEAPLAPHKRAQETHAIFHQNAKGLQRAYGISLNETRAIVKACPICSHHNYGVG
ncbi:POK18 protein, partial [Nyctiprogne leucopyga]|nr:POK18 protein [Nyctiprogne leucopyga]